MQHHCEALIFLLSLRFSLKYLERPVWVRQLCQKHINQLNSCLQFHTSTKSLLRMHLKTKDWGFHVFSHTIHIDYYSDDES